MSDSTIPMDNNNMETTANNTWLQGFIKILHTPSSIGTFAMVSPFRSIVFGVLLWVLASVTTQFITLSMPQLQKQQTQMQENDIRALGRSAHIDEDDLEEQVQDVRSKLDKGFSPTGTIAWALLYGFASTFVVGSLFWVLQRLFNSEPPPYLATIAVSAYGLTISSIGSIVTVALQAITGSIFASPSLAFLAAPIENSLSIFYTFLTKLNVFTVWEYLAVGIAVATHAGLVRKFGFIFGAVAFLAVLGISSIFVLLYSLMIA